MFPAVANCGVSCDQLETLGSRPALYSTLISGTARLIYCKRNNVYYRNGTSMFSIPKELCLTSPLWRLIIIETVKLAFSLRINLIKDDNPHFVNVFCLLTYKTDVRVIEVSFWQVRVELQPPGHTEADRVHRVELVAGLEVLHVLGDQRGPGCRSG